MLAGEKAFLPPVVATRSDQRGDALWIGLDQGPLTAPWVGIRNLNVALRRSSTSSPTFARAVVRRHAFARQGPGDVDMVIFRENSENVYAGIEWEAGSEGVAKLIFLRRNGRRQDRFPNTNGIGIGPFPARRPESSCCAPCRDNDRDSLTF